MSTALLMQKVAEAAPDKYQFLVETAPEVRDSPFRDEIVDRLGAMLEKAASMAGFGRAATGIGMAVGVGMANSLAGDMFDAVKRGLTKSRDYKAMLKENPDLHEHPAHSIQRVFNTLHRFNPEFASDPVVAGSFVRRQVQLADFDPQMLTNLVSSRKNLADTKKLQVPGRMPWESDDEVKHKGLQISELEQKLEHGKAKHPAELGKLEADTAKARGEAAGSSEKNQLAKMQRLLAENEFAKQVVQGGNQPTTARTKRRFGSP